LLLSIESSAKRRTASRRAVPAGHLHRLAEALLMGHGYKQIS
jgi:hypothetical protein